MSKKAVVTIVADKDGFVGIESFRDFIDVDKIVFYGLKLKKDRTIVLKFYDKSRKKVKPYGKR